MSPTLLDVAAIISLLVDGDEVPYLHDVLGTDLGFQINKNNNAYSTLINTFNRGTGPINEIEHKAFLLVWICQFFVYISSVTVIAEFVPYVSATLNRSYRNIGALFSPYYTLVPLPSCSKMKKGESIKPMFGPLWFLQLWIQHYFPEFFSEATMTHIIQLAKYGDYYM